VSDRLWAPWRLSYVKTDEPKRPGCFLCNYRDEDHDAENLVLLRGKTAAIVLNRFPYNNGHLLIAPLKHKACLSELTDEEHLECLQLITQMVTTIKNTMNADGFNVGLNLGKSAGAGLPGHLHWHVVPRWDGDTNFMPIVGDTKVIPQSLDELYSLLKSAL